MKNGRIGNQGAEASLDDIAFGRIVAYARRSCRPKAPPSEWHSVENWILGEAPGLPGEEYALRALLREELGAVTFTKWFENLRWEGMLNGALLVSVPSTFVKNWIRAFFAADLHRVATALFPAAAEVKMVVREPQQERGHFSCAGLVKWFDCRRGFGFITPFDGLPDVFIHREDLGRSKARRLLHNMPIIMHVKRCERGLALTQIIEADESLINPEVNPFRHGALPKAESDWIAARCVTYDAWRGTGWLKPLAGDPPMWIGPGIIQHFGMADFANGSVVYAKWGIGPKGCTIVALRPCLDQDVHEEFEEAEDADVAAKIKSTDVLRPTTPVLADLAGMEEAQQWAEDLVHDLALYKQKRLEWKDVDPGAVLVGPPGTGKTTFAKAIAATCKLPLIATSYTRWQQSGTGHMGNVLSAMEADFAAAKLNAPCILFIDELDSIPTRGATTRLDDWWVSIVNALLEKLDGIAGRPGVVVLGACNNASGLDPALTRAGRLDRIIEIKMPNTDALERILALHLGDDKKNVEGLRDIALLCAGMSGADVVQLVRKARRISRKENQPINKAALIAALDKDAADVTDEIKHRIAVHEAGHAVAAITTGVGKNISISLVMRGLAGGRMDLMLSDAPSMTREALDQRLVALLAGRAAEQVILGAVSGGAGGAPQSDLARATSLAIDIVSKLGLGHEGSLVWFGASNADAAHLMLDAAFASQIRRILDDAYSRAIRLVRTNEEAVRMVADTLLERRALAHEDLSTIIGRAHPRQVDWIDVMALEAAT